MSLCKHGINLNLRKCDRCEEVASVEGKTKPVPAPPPARREREFSFFDIDASRLDQEWLQHPARYYEYATRLAEVRAEWERAKADLDLVEAELDKEVRLEPERFGYDKLTESIVQKTIILQPAYRAARARVLQAKHDVDVAQVAVDTLEHRKRALEKTVDLWLASYFATPRAKGDTGKAMEEVTSKEVFGGKPRKAGG